MGDVHRHHVRFHHTLSRRTDNFSLTNPPKMNYFQWIKHLICDCPCIPCVKFFADVYIIERREFIFTYYSLDMGECPECVFDQIPKAIPYYAIDFGECHKLAEAWIKSLKLGIKLIL